MTMPILWRCLLAGVLLTALSVPPRAHAQGAPIPGTTLDFVGLNLTPFEGLPRLPRVREWPPPPAVFAEHQIAMHNSAISHFRKIDEVFFSNADWSNVRDSSVGRVFRLEGPGRGEFANWLLYVREESDDESDWQTWDVYYAAEMPPEMVELGLDEHTAVPVIRIRRHRSGDAVEWEVYNINVERPRYFQNRISAVRSGDRLEIEHHSSDALYMTTEKIRYVQEGTVVRADLVNHRDEQTARVQYDVATGAGQLATFDVQDWTPRCWGAGGAEVDC